MKVTGCKHLSYDQEKYPTCQVALLSDNHAVWERRGYDGLELVQFCNLRGRLNGPEYCTTKNRAMCSSFALVEHDIEVAE